MSNYIATVRYDKIQENGTPRRVSEHYLVNAVSVTDAEAVVNEQLAPYISGDFLTTQVRQSRIAEVFSLESADRFYLAKVAFITIDERTAREKRSISQILVGATDFADALRNFNEAMAGTTADFELVSLAESSIIEYYPAKS